MNWHPVDDYNPNVDPWDDLHRDSYEWQLGEDDEPTFLDWFAGRVELDEVAPEEVDEVLQAWPAIDDDELPF